MTDTYKITVPARVIGFLEGSQAWEDLEQRGSTDATHPTTAATLLAIMNGHLKSKGAIEAVFTRDQVVSLCKQVDLMYQVSDDDVYDRRCAKDFSRKIDRLFITDEV